MASQSWKHCILIKNSIVTTEDFPGIMIISSTLPSSLTINLPARASEQGNVFGLVSVYIYIYIYSCHKKKEVIERTRDLIYLKFVATDFFPKIISPSAGENSGDLA